MARGAPGSWRVAAAGLAVVASVTYAYTEAAAPEPVSLVDAKAVIDRYCVTCHTERLKPGGVVLEHRDLAQIGADADVWERVVRKLRARAMPPAGSPHPDIETLRHV